MIKVVSVFFIAIILCSCSIDNNNQERLGSLTNAPYPFKAMLAVCSDIDGTTLREFNVYHKYLNTHEESYLGKGLGLDVGDSFWMFAENDDGAVIDYDGATNGWTMSYYKEDSSGLKYNEEIIHYFNNGWIDTIHSYGDFSRVDKNKPVYTKEHGELANKEMKKHGLLPSVWINHGNSANVQNIKGIFNNSNMDYQQGGNQQSDYYHTDFTIASGIKFIWFSDASSRFAVDSPLYPVTLEDGQKVWGFHRYTGKGSLLLRHKYLWSIYDLNEQLTDKNLTHLVAEGKVAIVSQHLGTSNGNYVFPKSAREAFTRLKKYEDAKDILVARTSRLLEFVRIRDNLNYNYEISEEKTEIIKIISVDDPVLGTTEANAPDEFKGISFHVKNASTANIYINNVLADESLIVRSGQGEKNQIIGFKWYEKDVVDYTEGIK